MAAPVHPTPPPPSAHPWLKILRHPQTTACFQYSHCTCASNLGTPCCMVPSLMLWQLPNKHTHFAHYHFSYFPVCAVFVFRSQMSLLFVLVLVCNHARHSTAAVYSVTTTLSALTACVQKTYLLTAQDYTFGRPLSIVVSSRVNG